MIRQWLNGHLTTVLTTSLALVLSAAAIGSWTMVWKLNEWTERMEGEHRQYERRFDDAQRDRMDIKRRVRWLERQRTALTIWDMP